MLFIAARSLESEEMAEVNEWLAGHHIGDMKRLRRSFSDVWPLAVILKQDYPRLIDMANYPKRNRIALKMDNWQSFNNRVLLKLNLSLNKTFLEQLAKGTVGIIEVLIFELIRVEKRRRLAKEQKAAMRREKEKKSVEVSQEVASQEVASQEENGGQNRLIRVNIFEAPSNEILYARLERISHQIRDELAVIEMYQCFLREMERVRARTEGMNETVAIVGDQPPPLGGVGQSSPDEIAVPVLINQPEGDNIVQVIPYSKAILSSRLERFSIQCQNKLAVIEAHLSYLRDMGYVVTAESEPMGEIVTVVEGRVRPTIEVPDSV